MKNDYKHNPDIILSTANNLRWEMSENFHDKLMESIYANATVIAQRSVTTPMGEPKFSFDRALDKLVTSPLLGFPIMFLILAVIFWLTIEGANVPSSLLATLLIDNFHPVIKDFTVTIGFPWWLSGVLVDGAYLAGAWVISVMLPPMAIFFPLFTLLEDFGYLP
ncbi:MAG: ferrous iron transporter B, partial [Ignavibacteria bacterium]|nr:ferrous iron transporter B [Ignavibacteria bacterium]